MRRQVRFRLGLGTTLSAPRLSPPQGYPHMHSPTQCYPDPNARPTLRLSPRITVTHKLDPTLHPTHIPHPTTYHTQHTKHPPFPTNISQHITACCCTHLPTGRRGSLCKTTQSRAAADMHALTRSHSSSCYAPLHYASHRGVANETR